LNRRIFGGMLLITLITIVLVSAALGAVFYGRFSDLAQSSIHTQTEVYRKSDSVSVMREIRELRPDDIRATLIASDGSVVYDNNADAANMENHLSREEVASAAEIGFGESRRISATLGKETFYYAVRLTDGYILRLSKTTQSIWGMFGKAFPAVICAAIAVFIIGYMLSGIVTRRIAAPFNDIDTDGKLTAPYNEFAPFIVTIEKQRNQLSEQLDALQRHSATIDAIIDNMNEGLVLVGGKGEVISINKSATSLLGAEHAAPGGNLLEIIRDMEILNGTRKALDGCRGETVKEYPGKTCRFIFSPVPGGEAIILILDITDKAAGEALRREFSANVSHELKTPLTSISGYAEMLCNGMIKDADRDVFAGKIKDEAARLISLIEDIMLISKLDEGKGSESFEDVNVFAAAESVAAALALKAAENNISVQVAGDSGASVKADYTLIYEMLYNLIDNAVKYNNSGGSVSVGVSASDGRVTVTVSDTGIGIPREAQDRVFERFYRADKSRSKKIDGTGLGLAIVKHIVMIHGGTVELQSREGLGTTITVTI
jgi:two-component system phosphate regulon sensor histidine kinase PhoR